jgi:mRNA-degrading endonuclease HigB of HigAB toxin-antitoxin module
MNAYGVKEVFTVQGKTLTFEIKCYDKTRKSRLQLMPVLVVKSGEEVIVRFVLSADEYDKLKYEFQK